MYQFFDVEQNTDEWLELRIGKLTGSNLGKVMANYGKAFGEPAKRLAVDIAVEQLTGERANSHYTNEHMERGHDEEPQARFLYESQTFSEVTNGGFFLTSEGVGCSPDGLVDSYGLIEIKSVIPSTHYANIKRGGIDPAYKWQCIGNLGFTGREWLDFVSYCSSFPDRQQLYIHRIYAADLMEEFDMIANRIADFNDIVVQILTHIRSLTEEKS